MEVLYAIQIHRYFLSDRTYISLFYHIMNPLDIYSVCLSFHSFRIQNKLTLASDVEYMYHIRH